MEKILATPSVGADRNKGIVWEEVGDLKSQAEINFFYFEPQHESIFCLKKGSSGHLFNLFSPFHATIKKI